MQGLFMEQLGVMNLSAALKAKGHSCRLALGSDKEILKAARDWRPDMVGVTVLTGFQQRWIRLARLLKSSLDPVPLVVFGGPHATFFPEVVLSDGVDIACRGEGERAIVELADAVDKGIPHEDTTGILSTIPNLCFRNPVGATYMSPLRVNAMRPLEVLDELPFPDRELSFTYPFIRRDPNVHFMVGRGCPYSCSFCFNRQMREMCKDLGPAVRFRSISNVIEEIKEVRRRWGIRVAYFQDDTFVLSPTWLFSFLERYSLEIRLPLYCTVRADLVTKEMAEALKEAGCYRVSFGVESGVERIRNEVLDKRVRDEEIRRAAKILTRAGITFQTTNMMGLPGERLEDAFRTLELNIAIGADIAWTSLYQPYPGTSLGQHALDRGIVDKLPDDERIADAHTSSIMNQPDIKEIERLQKLSYLAVKLPRLMPLVRKLVHKDKPRLYYWIHRITYLLFYFRKITKMSFKRTLEEAWTAWKYY